MSRGSLRAFAQPGLLVTFGINLLTRDTATREI